MKYSIRLRNIFTFPSEKSQIPLPQNKVDQTVKIILTIQTIDEASRRSIGFIKLKSLLESLDHCSLIIQVQSIDFWEQHRSFQMKRNRLVYFQSYLEEFIAILLQDVWAGRIQRILKFFLAFNYVCWLSHVSFHFSKCLLQFLSIIKYYMYDIQKKKYYHMYLGRSPYQ